MSEGLENLILITVFTWIGIFIGYQLAKSKYSTNWNKLIKWIKNHRKDNKASFDVATNSDTFIITVSGSESTSKSWEKNMLRIKYKELNK